MRKTVLILLCLPLFGRAQSLFGGNNIVKWNTTSTIFRNYSFTYERNLFKHVSLSLNFRTMPKGTLPFQSQLAKVIETDDINFGSVQIGNIAWTPELRIYLGKGKLKGFYFGPYVRFASFDMSVPISYQNVAGNEVPAVFGGTIKSTSAGLLIGWQFQLLEKLVLDFQIAGGHYGSSSGTLTFTPTTPLTPLEQAYLQKNLNDINPGPFKFSSSVNANGAVIHPSGWAGVRALNLGLGFRF